MLGVLHERLLRDAPGARYRREVAPAVGFAETRRTVDTQVGFEQVTLLEVVVQTAEVGLDGPFVAVAAVVHVLDLAHVDLIVVGVVEDLAVGRKVLVVVGVAFGAEDEFQVMAAEILLEGHQEVVVAVEGARSRFGERGVGSGGERGRTLHVLIGRDGLLPVVFVGGRVARCQHSLQREPFDRFVGQRDRPRQTQCIVLVLAAFEHQRYGVVALQAQAVVESRRELVGDVGRTGVHVVEDRSLVGRRAAVAVREREIEFHRQLVVELDVGVVAERVALEIGSLDDTVLIDIAQRGEHPHAFAADAERNGVAVREARAGEDGILPVGIGIEVGILAHVLAVKRHRLVVVGRGVAVLQVHGVGQLAVFECVDRFGQVGRRLPADGSLVGDGEAFGRAAFGRHQNDAVGRARTVDRRRRCVFEDGDGFDEYGIDAVQTALDPVDEHQRGGRAAAERIDTADADGTTVGTRGARRRGDGHARSHTLQGDRCRNDRTLFEGRGIDRRYRTRDVDFFLGAVTDDDDIVDLFAVALKSDLVKGFRGDLYGRFPIPDVGNRQLLALGGVYGKFTFGVGRSSPPLGPGVLHDDYGRSDQRRPFRIGDDSVHGGLLGECDYTECRETDCQQQSR